MMRVIETEISGCYEIQGNVFRDERGRFVKTFHKDLFVKNGLEGNFEEEYYTVSLKRVLRGMHFQIPPHEHAKLVYCILGSVLDAVVDLRMDSPTYAEHATFKLSADQANMIYIPVGMAHGFYVLSEEAIVVYNVTSMHSPDHDTGILWSSAGICWPDKNPIVTTRDSQFVALSNFQSPFHFKRTN